MVLYFQDSRRGQLVQAVSPAAGQLGVRCWMPLSEAKALLQRGTKETQQPFYLLEHDPEADLQALTQLADGLTLFSPLIGMEDCQIFSNSTARSSRQNQSASHPSHSPSSILLDITGIGRLYGGDDRLAEELYQHLQQRNYLPRLAIADTLAVAWGVSHFATDSWIVVPPADNTLFGQLPLSALRLNPQTITTLHRLGIVTIEQLQQIPRDELAMRFGNEIHQRLDQAAGYLAEPIMARHPPNPFTVRQVLDYPISHQPTLIAILDRLVTELCQQMKSRQQGALQWSIALILVDQSPLRMTINLFQPSSDPADMVPLIQMQLESPLQHGTSANQMRGGQQSVNRTSMNQTLETDAYPLVQEVIAQVTNAVLLVPRQRKLFDESPRLDKLGLAQLINRLASRLGTSNVVGAKLRSGVEPEFAYRFYPLVGPTNLSQKHHKKSSSPSVRSKPARLAQGVEPKPIRSQSHLAARPLRIFQPAVSIEISCWKIRQRWGPERIETGWWRGPTVCRNYWRIEIETGQHYWIYQDLRSEQWFLQGEF